jgi:hypothetical protein
MFSFFGQLSTIDMAAATWPQSAARGGASSPADSATRPPYAAPPHDAAGPLPALPDGAMAPTPWEPIPPRTAAPPPRQQLNLVKAAEHVHRLRAGETGFLVSAGWLRHWQNFVGYDGAWPIGDSPGPIDNRDIDARVSIDWQSIREGFDYVVLARAVWDLLFGWFGGGPDIPVPMTSGARGPVPDFRVAVGRMWSFVFQHKDAAQTINTPRERLIRDLKIYIMEQFDVDMSGQYRLVDFFSDKVQGVFDDGKTLVDYKLYEGQKIVLDYMEDGQWVTETQPPPEPLINEKQKQLRMLMSKISRS